MLAAMSEPLLVCTLLCICLNPSTYVTVKQTTLSPWKYVIQGLY